MVVPIALALAALCCALVAGFLVAFAVVVMPGLRDLGDRAFLEAFRTVDGVIQRGSALFGLVWLGSAAAPPAALALAWGAADGPARGLLALGAAVALLGVHLPTVLVHLPLNRAVQALDLDAADEAALRAARRRFEPRWNRWNRIRTALAVVATLLLLAGLALAV